jgi:shikimate kinase
MLGVKFIDTDELIAKEGNVRELALFLGEKKFRDLESFAIESIGLDDHAVIATGGGVILRKSNIDSLKNLGSIVYLECDKFLIKERMSKCPIPSFLDPDNLEKSFEKMYQEREPLYKNLSDCIVSILNRPDHLVLSDLVVIFEKFLSSNV